MSSSKIMKKTANIQNNNNMHFWPITDDFAAEGKKLQTQAVSKKACSSAQALLMHARPYKAWIASRFHAPT
jgi:hypothetical protein